MTIVLCSGNLLCALVAPTARDRHVLRALRREHPSPSGVLLAECASQASDKTIHFESPVTISKQMRFNSPIRPLNNAFKPLATSHNLFLP